MLPGVALGYKALTTILRLPIINPYKKNAPAAAPTSAGVATDPPRRSGRRQNNSTKSASQLAAENQ
eukprot:scaffold24596_cov164-Skeletonema_dohrnii-CCMP3373.AAC.1